MAGSLPMYKNLHTQFDTRLSSHDLFLTICWHEIAWDHGILLQYTQHTWYIGRPRLSKAKFNELTFAISFYIIDGIIFAICMGRPREKSFF